MKNSFKIIISTRRSPVLTPGLQPVTKDGPDLATPPTS